jgi:hypothetical protein
MVKHLLIIFTIFLISISIFEAKKKRKRRTNTEKKTDPKLLKPNAITSELWCDTCNAIVRETHKLLRGKKSEGDVYEITEDVCNPERYYTYSHPPPDMKQGCDAFIDRFIEDIQKLFTRRDTDDVNVLESRLCKETTRACVEVDPKNVKPFDNKIMIDGQPHELGPDGKPKKPDEDL